MRRDQNTKNLEFRAELLKERIYATLALLAVLLTIDDSHTSPLKAAAIVAGTALSLWAASLVAARMSYRVVMQRVEPDHTFKKQLVTHSPLLVAAVFPVMAILLSATGLFGIVAAINISIASQLLLLIAWSLLSARALNAGWVTTVVLAAVEVAIGIAIIGLKAFVGH